MAVEGTLVRRDSRASSESLEWWLSTALPPISAAVAGIWILAWGHGWSSSFDSGQDFLAIDDGRFEVWSPAD